LVVRLIEHNAGKNISMLFLRDLMLRPAQRSRRC
jgi:hypothetical protein